jgi:hypothetical protein
MPTENRRRWMRDYMREYRQGKLRTETVQGCLPAGNPDKREELKATNRLNNFKWRISELLGPQYEIIECIQDTPLRGTFEDGEWIMTFCKEEFCRDMDRTDIFVSKDFRDICDIGGGEIFKALLLEKFSKKFDWINTCYIGVLDKLALLKSLQKLPRLDNNKWNIVLNKVVAEPNQDMWGSLDLSNCYYKQIDDRTICYLLKCTAREHPVWNSLRLYSFLYGWATGVRKIGPGELYENLGAVDDIRRLIRSPILSCDEERVSEFLD